MDINNIPPSKQHLGIWGKTGSGKSAFSTFLHNKNKYRSIYFNFEDKPRDKYKIKGKKIDRNTPKSHIKKALRDSDKRLHKLKYECHYKPEIMDKELNNLYKTIKSIRPIIYVFIDEAHEFSDALLRMIKKADGYKIRVIPISQRPKDVGTDINSNIEDNVFFKLNKQQKHYIKQYFNYKEIKKHTDKEYHWTLVDKHNKIHRYSPISIKKIM